MSLLEGTISEDALGDARLLLAKSLLTYGYSSKQAKDFLLFLKHMLFTQRDDINRIFDKQLEKLTEGSIDMSVQDVLLQLEREQGEKRGKKQEAFVIATEMKKEGIPVEQIIRFTKLSQKEINAIKS